VVALHRDLSAHNLNPSTQLYAVTAPFFLQTQRSLTLRLVVVYYVLALAFTAIIVPAGCLLHHAARRKV
jgi:hypothetical protein